MQFVPNGPDVPEGMLQAHEDGRLVFFCGAGISYPAGLPGFRDLVTGIYRAVGEPPNALQEQAISQCRYDIAIGLLEESVAGRRERVRRELARILTADPTVSESLATHEALLRLSENRAGQVRLVTTNFDRLFELAIKERNRPVETFCAPFLPPPKHRWNGLIYLHGRLEEAPTREGLDRLVVSSGDFGLAYLTERWAARFVSELFRSFSVCFVGYSIEDPVLRYMMDALAADRILGETPPEMFAFGSFAEPQRQREENAWRSKNVTPILYREDNKHALLHKTLREWGATFRDGVRGKEHIVVSTAMSKPASSTAQDDFVRRMLWALGDASGLPAKAFADFDLAPPLEWLGPLCDEVNGTGDLPRFGIASSVPNDPKFRFSFLSRPAPHTHAPRLTLADAGDASCKLDAPLRHLARWLSRHLDDPELILWVARQGGRLHPDFAWHVNRRLEEVHRAARALDGCEELDRLKRSSPRGVPRPGMCVLWRLALSGRLKSRRNPFETYEWADRFKRDGMTPSIRMGLRRLLTPCIAIRKAFRLSDRTEPHLVRERPRDIVHCELELAGDDVRTFLRDLRSSAEWNSALPALLPDATLLLRDAMDLMREVEGAEDKSDFSYIYRRSIADHPQNRDHEDWTILIELARDAWVEVFKSAPAHARQAAAGWWWTPYPVFKRLALFAAAQGSAVPPTEAVEWLLEDDAHWLWSVEVRREALRLIAALCADPAGRAALRRLEAPILAGPPREMYGENITEEEWAGLVEREKWLRLALMRSEGAELGDASVREFDTLTCSHPEWGRTDDQRDEFPIRSAGGWVGNRKPWLKASALPRERRALLAHLRAQPEPSSGEQDDWAERCRSKLRVTAWVLCSLARDGVWPVARWREALQTWTEPQLLRRSWRYLGPTVKRANDAMLISIAPTLSWWLQGNATSLEVHEDSFLALCHRLLRLKQEDSSHSDDPVGAAINHPVGQLAEALLRWWYRTGPVDGQTLPALLKTEFTRFCSSTEPAARHGRVLLAAHVISLFRVDPVWTVQYLLPFFDWNRSVPNAREAWEGFLWSPRLHAALLQAISGSMLDTATHLGELGKHQRQYSTLLTFIALELPDLFSTEQLATAMRALPNDALGDVASALVEGLSGAGEKAGEYWQHRVGPYLRLIWPKARDRITPAVSDAFARLCVAARDRFPEAFELVKDWLRPLEHSEYVVHRLADSGLCSTFPETALNLLGTIVDENTPWGSPKLKTCLDEVLGAAPALTRDRTTERLLSFLRARQ